MTQNNNRREASATKDRQSERCVHDLHHQEYTVCLKKLVGLIVFEKDIFDIYLNNICHIVFSLYLVCKCLGEHRLHAMPSNKISQIFTNFQIHENYVALETESNFPNKEFNVSVGLFVYAVLHKHH